MGNLGEELEIIEVEEEIIPYAVPEPEEEEELVEVGVE